MGSLHSLPQAWVYLVAGIPLMIVGLWLVRRIATVEPEARSFRSSLAGMVDRLGVVALVVLVALLSTIVLLLASR